jgi:hypothetical protein
MRWFVIGISDAVSRETAMWSAIDELVAKISSGEGTVDDIRRLERRAVSYEEYILELCSHYIRDVENAAVSGEIAKARKRRSNVLEELNTYVELGDRTNTKEAISRYKSSLIRGEIGKQYGAYTLSLTEGGVHRPLPLKLPGKDSTFIYSVTDDFPIPKQYPREEGPIHLVSPDGNENGIFPVLDSYANEFVNTTDGYQILGLNEFVRNTPNVKRYSSTTYLLLGYDSPEEAKSEYGRLLGTVTHEGGFENEHYIPNIDKIAWNAGSGSVSYAYSHQSDKYIAVSNVSTHAPVPWDRKSPVGFWAKRQEN